MADHMRKQIRVAAAAALTGLAATGANVFPSRVYQLQPSELPGLRVFTKDEQSEPQTLGFAATRVIERNLQLVVECCVKGTTGYDDDLDEVVRQVEVAIASNQDLGVGVKWITPASTETEMEGTTEKPVAVATLTFNCFYYTAQNAPDTAL